MIIRGKEREREGREKIGGGSFLKKAPSPEPPPFPFQRLSAGGEAVRQESRCVEFFLGGVTGEAALSLGYVLFKYNYLKLFK